MMSLKPAFSGYIHAENIEGSKKAASYIRALDLLSQMIESNSFGFEDCKNIWEVKSVERLHELYLFVLNEAKKGEVSPWNIEGIPTSYLQKGYCSAALRSYQEFLVTHVYEQAILKIFDQFKGDESTIAQTLDKEFEYPRFLLEGLDKKMGKDVVRSVKTRSNQNVFREIILKLYNQSCCVTGLNIPAVNRASHIIPWADNPEVRLDPRNGLCLSATYDAAFDKNLISLDDDFRIIISKEIKNYYTKESVREYFLRKEGDKIVLPSAFFPHRDYLQVHRDSGRF